MEKQTYILRNTHFVLVLFLALFSCKSTDPVPINEEELITTLIYELTSKDGGDPVQFKFQDLDGDGGNPPEIMEGKLQADKEYSGKLILLNETTSPAIDISEEVLEEGAEHQVFYEITHNAFRITYADTDENGNPVGLKTDAATVDAEEGTLTITLRHNPEKGAEGVSDGDIANAGGDTDIEVTFQVVIE